VQSHFGRTDDSGQGIRPVPCRGFEVSFVTVLRVRLIVPSVAGLRVPLNGLSHGFWEPTTPLEPAAAHAASPVVV
jgi:hypothetical protein